MPEPFWIVDPRSLVMSAALVPSPEMDEVQRLNVMARLVVLGSLFLFLLGFSTWLFFLLGGLLLTVLAWLAVGKEPAPEPLRQYWRPPPLRRRSFKIRPYRG